MPGASRGDEGHPSAGPFVSQRQDLGTAAGHRVGEDPHRAGAAGDQAHLVGLVDLLANAPEPEAPGAVRSDHEPELRLQTAAGAEVQRSLQQADRQAGRRQLLRQRSDVQRRAGEVVRQPGARQAAATIHRQSMDSQTRVG